MLPGVFRGKRSPSPSLPCLSIAGRERLLPGAPIQELRFADREIPSSDMEKSGSEEDEAGSVLRCLRQEQAPFPCRQEEWGTMLSLGLPNSCLVFRLSPMSSRQIGLLNLHLDLGASICLPVPTPPPAVKTCLVHVAKQGFTSSNHDWCCCTTTIH